MGIAIALGCALGITTAPSRAVADQGQSFSRTRVTLNGHPTPVRFSDGDTFKALSGPHAHIGARLEGFNALESYGPVHRFGRWHPKELAVIAKMATVHAQSGVWSCVSELKRDIYDRILWTCDDLAIDLIRRGLAHAMTITEKPAPSAHIEAQRHAIEARRGMWAHGVPQYILTSAHSASAAARAGRDRGPTYNRLVSTRDGHSVEWIHENRHRDCEEVCSRERRPREAWILEVVQALQRDPSMEEVVAKLGAELLERVVRDFAALGFIPRLKRSRLAAPRAGLLRWLEEHAEPALAEVPFEEGSCLLFVEFERRYGQARPRCLR